MENCGPKQIYCLGCTAGAAPNIIGMVLDNPQIFFDFIHIISFLSQCIQAFITFFNHDVMANLSYLFSLAFTSLSGHYKSNT